jgi:ribonucleoside-triphosphate reductase
LSNLSDDRMRHAKTGTFPPHRYLSNNSVVYTEKPDAMSFLREWVSLAESGSGERGVFNREASKAQAAKNGRRDPNFDFGTNPCSEIILRPNQFCNLTEVVVRAGDDFKELERKVILATILGTIQSTYTKMPYLRKVWKDNTEEERLLGVSLTGIKDNAITRGKAADLETVLNSLRLTAVATNKKWAKILGIPQSAATTCVKPSGTVSQLADSASGIHERYAEYFIRTVRGDNKDPLTQFMKDQGIPHEPCVYKGDTTTVFSFPMKAPEGAELTKDVTAIGQLKSWLTYQRHWCEHKPSVTISVRPDEWFEVGAFVYEHFDEMSGVSFLPFDDHVYQQAPYQEIDKEKYEELLSEMPEGIDWEKFGEYEQEDNTVAMQSLACTSGVCELVDIN